MMVDVGVWVKRGGLFVRIYRYYRNIIDTIRFYCFRGDKKIYVFAYLAQVTQKRNALPPRGPDVHGRAGKRERALALMKKLTKEEKKQEKSTL